MGERVVLGLVFQWATLAVERIPSTVDNPLREDKTVLNGLFLCGEGVCRIELHSAEFAALLTADINLQAPLT